MASKGATITAAPAVKKQGNAATLAANEMPSFIPYAWFRKDITEHMMSESALLKLGVATPPTSTPATPMAARIAQLLQQYNGGHDNNNNNNINNTLSFAESTTTPVNARVLAPTQQQQLQQQAKQTPAAKVQRIQQEGFISLVPHPDLRFMLDLLEVCKPDGSVSAGSTSSSSSNNNNSIVNSKASTALVQIQPQQQPQQSQQQSQKSQKKSNENTQTIVNRKNSEEKETRNKAEDKDDEDNDDDEAEEEENNEAKKQDDEEEAEKDENKEEEDEEEEEEEEAIDPRHMTPIVKQRVKPVKLRSSRFEPYDGIPPFLLEANKSKSKKPSNSDAENNDENQLAVNEEDTPLTLHPYQLEGLNWMRANVHQYRNCILADEMGLGKTVQAICLLLSLKHDYNIKNRFLIVTPLTTLPNWVRELKKWTTFTIYEAKTDVSMRSDINITSYERLRMHKSQFNAQKWNFVIFDEAHRLKTIDSQIRQCASTLNCGGQLLLTGTPLQNNSAELWSLLNYVDRYVFEDEEDFMARYGNITSKRSVQMLREELKDYVLARKKSQVLMGDQVIPREEILVELALTVEQKKLYRAIYERNAYVLKYKLAASKFALCNF